ncbi:MAG: PAS domain S-box-containing protein [Desulforhopalus sp.]|jgi:PAS domain S-box-containing protein
MKNLASIILTTVFLILGCALPLFAQNPLPKIDASFGQPNQQIILTPGEQAWLAAHPNIRLGYIDSAEPEVIVSQNGSHTGMLVDFLAELNRRLGTQIGLKIDTIPGILEQAKTNKVDGILEMLPEYADKLGLLKTETYLTAYPAVFGRRSDIVMGLSDIAGKKVAISDKIYFSEKIAQQYFGQSTIVKVSNSLEGMRLISQGDVDFFIGTSFNSYLLVKYHLFDLAVKHVFFDLPSRFGMAIRADWPELVSILNKGITSFTEREIDEFMTKWFHFLQQEKTVELTSAETVWLAAHPVITFGVAEEFPPLNFINKDGEPAGYGIDYAILIARTLGIQYKFVSGSWSDVQQMAKAKEIDAIPLIFKNKDRDKYLEYTKPYTKMVHAIITKKKTQSIQSLKDLSDKRVGVMEGTYVHNYMQEDYPDTDIIAYSTYGEFLGALTNGEVDAIVDTLPVLSYWINTLFTTNLKIVALPVELERNTYLGIRSDRPELTGIINKAIDAITIKQHSEIKQKWVGLNTEDKEIKTSITPEEQLWIAKNHTIRVRVTDSPPYLYSEKGQAVGITVDLLKVISKRTGIKFHFVIPSPSFAKDLKGLIQHTGPDLIATLMPNPEREKDILFTNIYISSPWFIFTRDSSPFIVSMNDLNGRTVAVVKDYLVHEYLVKNYPDIELLILENNKKALSAVSSGKAFAFIGDLISTPAMINKFGLNNLKAVSPSSLQEHKTAMGIRSDWPELRDIIDKVLDSMPASEKTAIINKWASVKFDYGISPYDVKKWVFIIGSTVALILFLILFWNRSLTRRVKERTSTLAESQDRLRLATAAARVAIWDFDPRSNTVFLSPEWKQQLGYEDDELESRIEEWESRMHPDEREEAIGMVEDYLAGRIPEYAMEFRLRHKDGSYRWVYTRGEKQLDDAGNPVRILGCHVDITEQKQGKALLEESEERFRATFEQAAVGIAHVAPDGTFLRLNQKFCDIVGYSQEEMQSLTFQKITHPDDLARDLGYVQEILSGRRSSYSIEKRYVRKDSEIIWVNLTVAAVHMEESEPGWFVSVVEEISDRKQAEEDILRYQKRLKALASQLTITEEKERRRLATDLHDHVGQSLVFSRIQLAGLKEQTSDEEFIESIDEVSQSLLGIIKDTKDLVFDLSSPLLNEIGLSAATSQWLVEQIGEKYGLETECIDNCKTLSLDNEMKALLFRSIRELLANVIKHAFAKKIRVFFDKKNKDNLMITVQDDGVGFVFNRAPEMVMSREGFGLFSIKERVEDIGGFLDIESEPGKGSKITMNIPLTRQ